MMHPEPMEAGRVLVSETNRTIAFPVRTVSANGKTCRETAVSVIDDKKRTADGHDTFCHSAQGQWQRSTTP